MTDYAVPPTERPVLPVRGTDAVFPVRRVYCIGRNYADHAVEMGQDPERDPPFFFQKNPDNLDTSGVFPYPPQTGEVHFEMEMVVALGKGGRDIGEGEALGMVWGYGMGLDMTRRDLQAEAKAAGRPWEIGKAFERSAPMSQLVPAAESGHLREGAIELRVNGDLRQQGNLNQMIWKVPEQIAQLSRFYEIAAGDLVFSGTPAGVGPVERGDVLEGSVEGLGSFTVTVG